MKKLLFFYSVILSPLALIFWLSDQEIVDSWVILVLILIYALLYRTYTDGMRLVHKEVIPKSEIWKMLIPGTRFRYFKELYFL